MNGQMKTTPTGRVMPVGKPFTTQNLNGQRFGRLQVIGLAPKAGSRTIWLCKCDCGNLTRVGASDLKSGNTRSCQCLRREDEAIRAVTHGESRKGQWTPEYRTYAKAKERCRNPNAAGYCYYGGRGIEFRFASFDEFLAAVGRRPSSDYSIDRIDVNGHYEQDNVRWLLKSKQAANRRPFSEWRKRI